MANDHRSKDSTRPTLTLVDQDRTTAPPSRQRRASQKGYVVVPLSAAELSRIGELVVPAGEPGGIGLAVITLPRLGRVPVLAYTGHDRSSSDSITSELAAIHSRIVALIVRTDDPELRGRFAQLLALLPDLGEGVGALPRALRVDDSRYGRAVAQEIGTRETLASSKQPALVLAVGANMDDSSWHEDPSRGLAPPPPRESGRHVTAGESIEGRSTAVRFLDRVVGMLREEPDLHWRQIRTRLEALGFSGGRTSFQELLRAARSSASGFAPGEAVQHGLGVARVLIAGGKSRNLPFLATRLCSSRAGRLTWLPHDPERVIRAVVADYAALGGRPGTAILHGFRRIRGDALTCAMHDLDIRAIPAGTLRWVGLASVLADATEAADEGPFSTLDEGRAHIAARYTLAAAGSETAALRPLGATDFPIRYRTMVDARGAQAFVCHDGVRYRMPVQSAGLAVEMLATPTEIRVEGRGVRESFARRNQLALQVRR